jgi:hypothetical protein
MPNLLDWVSRVGQIEVARPVTLGVTVWMTYNAYQWAAAFADASSRGGAEVAMIIAAVIAPVSVLQGYVFKAYIGGGS